MPAVMSTETREISDVFSGDMHSPEMDETIFDAVNRYGNLIDRGNSTGTILMSGHGLNYEDRIHVCDDLHKDYGIKAIPLEGNCRDGIILYGVDEKIISGFLMGYER